MLSLDLIEQAVGALQRLEPLRREPEALEADAVQSVGLRLDAVGLAERQHVLAQLRVGAGERVPPDPRELVGPHEGAEHGMVSHVHVPRQGGGVGEDRERPDAAVVRHVAVGHEVVVVADHRLAVAGHGPPVDRRELAEDVAGAD